MRLAPQSSIRFRPAGTFPLPARTLPAASDILPDGDGLHRIDRGAENRRFGPLGGCPPPALWAAGEWDMCRNGRYTERGITRRAPLDRWSKAPEHRPGDIKAIIDFSQL
jgi:hypothetical protein